MIQKERLLSITKERVAFLLIFVLMFALTEIGRKVYRPYIYSNDVFDFWIADTVGNLTGTMTIVFFELAIINPRRRMAMVLLLIITLGLTVYEVVQYFSPRSVLDWRDIVATLTGGLISLGVYELLHRRYKDEPISRRKRA